MVLERACNLGWVRYSGTVCTRYKCSFKKSPSIFFLLFIIYFCFSVFFSDLAPQSVRQGPFDLLFYFFSLLLFFPQGRAHSVLRGRRRLYGWCTVFLTIFGM